MVLTKLTLLFLLLPYPAGAGPLEQEILGGWHYSGFFYDGHRFQNPNPNLHLRFSFLDNGTARLYWNRENEPGFCERLSDYSVENGSLRQKVTWLNPANDSSCGKDPDMQMGRETENKIDVVDKELHIFMQLNGQDFIYILTRDE